MFSNITEEEGIIKFYFLPVNVLDVKFNVEFKKDGLNKSEMDFTDCKLLLKKKGQAIVDKGIEISLNTDGKYF